MDRKRTGYMDDVDFTHELGEAMGGNSIYSSVRDLKENNECWDGCGIVKVEVKFLEQITKADWKKGAMTAKECEEYEGSEEHIKHLKAKEKHFRDIAERYKAHQKRIKKSDG